MNWITSWQHLLPNIQGSTAGPLGKLSLGNGKAVQVRTIAKSRTEIQLLLQSAVLLEGYQAPVSSVPMIPMCLGLYLLDSLTCCPLGVQWTALLRKAPMLPWPLSCPPRPCASALHPRGCNDIQSSCWPAACPWCPPQSPAWCCPQLRDWPSLCLCPQSGCYLPPCQASSPEPGLSRGPGQHYVRAKTCLAHSPRWQANPVKGTQAGRAPLAPPVVAQCPPESTPSSGFCLPDRGVLCLQTAHPLPHGRSVPDHHQSALPKSAFSEEPVDPRSLEEQAEESRQVSDGQGCVYTSGASCGHGYTWIYIFSCVFT